MVSKEGDCEPSVRSVTGFSLVPLSMDQGERECKELCSLKFSDSKESIWCLPTLLKTETSTQNDLDHIIISCNRAVYSSSDSRA